MAENYKQIIDPTTGETREDSVIRLSDGAQVLAGGPEWREYQTWLATGNAVVEPDEPPAPPPADVASQLAALLIAKGTITADELHPETLAKVNADLTASGEDAIVVADEVKP